MIPAFLAVSERAGDLSRSSRMQAKSGAFLWAMVAFFLTLAIGLRFRVGGDWQNYFRFLRDVEGLDFLSVVTKEDPGYYLLNWVSLNLGFGIIGVNFVSGAAFSVGLTKFCRAQPRPWLAMCVSVPYLVIVVAMGYTRQSIALGLIMIGLVELENRRIMKFLFWVAVGALFHKSAVLVAPIAALASTQNRMLTYFIVGLTAILLYRLLLSSEVETLYQNYVTAEYQSDGALIRLVMNAVPAVLLLRWPNRFGLQGNAQKLWVWFARFGLLFLALFAVSSASTALDRVALYVLPLQILVFSRLPSVLSQARTAARKVRDAVDQRLGQTAVHSETVSSVVICVIVYYALIQFVWLGYANNSHYWIPYDNYIWT